MWSGRSSSAFQRNVLPPSSGMKNIPSKQPASWMGNTWKTLFRHRPRMKPRENHVEQIEEYSVLTPRRASSCSCFLLSSPPHCLQPVTLQVHWSLVLLLAYLLPPHHFVIWSFSEPASATPLLAPTGSGWAPEPHFHVWLALLASLPLKSSWWKCYAHPKRSRDSTRLHNITSQETLKHNNTLTCLPIRRGCVCSPLVSRQVDQWELAMDTIDARCPDYDLEYCMRPGRIGVCRCLPWCPATNSWLYQWRQRKGQVPLGTHTYSAFS
jgi:hypothetical protein